MSINLASIASDLEKGAVAAAKATAINFVEEAGKDAVAFLAVSLPAIERYLNFLVSGQITQTEFESLMLGLKDLALMNGLTQAGLAAIQIQLTRNSILNAVTSIALGAASAAIKA